MVKIILKTFIKTVLALVVVLVVAVGVVSLAFPQHMATACESVGEYRIATGYASLRHFYTNDLSDLDRCARDSILSGDNGDIVKFCSKLVGEEEFERLCAESSENFDYKQYICGNLAVAQYETGDKSAALGTATAAMEGVEGFPVNNALALLSISVAEQADGETAKSLLADVATATPVGEKEQRYLDSVINILQDIGE